MEYIEREAVMLQINAADFVRDDNYEAGATLLFQDDVVDRISSIPTADVRPVVRGQWVESKSIMDVIYCSECGFRTIYGAMPDGLGRNYSYCPNCGADMREES